MSVKIEAVTESVQCGEGPHWDSTEQALYYVGMMEAMYKYVPETGQRTSSKLSIGSPSFLIPVSGKPQHFVAGVDRKVVEVKWDGQQDTAEVVRTVCEVDHDNPGNKINDGKADPRGRLFTGTMGAMLSLEKMEFDKKKGSLYRIDSNGKTHRLSDKIDLSNGLCWDVDAKAFYYVDSLEYAIRRYDYDIDTGNISNPRKIFDFKEHNFPGFADGMTIDTDGNLWVAHFDGHQVLNIDPRTGKLIRSIRIPALQVTSLTFGGPTLTDLYVTTGCVNLPHVKEEQKPPAGSTFKITGLGVKGHPSVSVKLD